jgi:heterodisulfide reductase subunit D
MSAGAPELRMASPPAEEVFNPRVLVFACNWCSYAGADTAGVSRLQQTPHFRLLRVMCSGRVHPAHVLRAFARGADGVMVSGCHFGDCHYRFGNYRAVEQFEKTRALVALLGLDERRLRLEWISAAEGVRFAEIMNEFVDAVRAAGPSGVAPANEGAPAGSAALPAPADPAFLAGQLVRTCLECGRCTAVCPVARYQRFSPRRLVSRAIASGAGDLRRESSLWACLTCRACQVSCPMGIDVDGFVLAARAAVPRPYHAEEQEAELACEPSRERACAEGDIAPCSHGGVFEQVSLMAARPGLRQQRLGWLTPELRVAVAQEGEAATQADLLFAGCSPYFAAYFGGEIGAHLTESLRSAVRLLNRAGVTPALLANERCCGHHLRLAGRTADADALEALVMEQIRSSGCRRVIAYCPECLVALRAAVGRHHVACEVVHLSEVLSPASAALAEAFASASPRDVAITYQDPCRLGRYSHLYDEPRALLAGVAARPVREMAHVREAAICCGNTAWLNCNAATKRFQAARLAEAAATGSRELVTACPGCFIHLRCAQEGMRPAPDGAIRIVDLWNVLAGSQPEVPARPEQRGPA